MASSTLTVPPAIIMDGLELDAARALLGVSPSVKSHPRASYSAATAEETEGDGVERHGRGREEDQEAQSPSLSWMPAASSSSVQESLVSSDSGTTTTPCRPRSSSVGLDALATLASKEQEAAPPRVVASSSSTSALLSATSSSSGEDEDAEAMMPPPPPRGRRRRSASNPEGMEKWDSMNRCKSASSRCHFVLPAAILEEELAEASAAVKEQEEKLPLRTVPENKPEPSGDTTMAESTEESGSNGSPVSAAASGTTVRDESNLSSEELLRRARSRLLEDLSEGSINGEKGVLTLPHSLAKYKEVYNKNGRIGIYTPAERAAIIARFNGKRARRVWNKKIRYNCRKSLADRRLRVKGRFVKRSEQEQLAKQLQGRTNGEASTDNDNDDDGNVNKAQSEIVSATTVDTGKASSSVETGNTDTANTTVENTATTTEPSQDEDMPDVNDPEAGFVPTEDQPYRRLRRHTIT